MTCVTCTAASDAPQFHPFFADYCLHCAARRIQFIQRRLNLAPDVKRNRCRAPQPDAPRLEAPKADPAKVAAEIAKQTGLKAAFAPKADGKEWARSIVTQAANGARIRPYTLLSARQALGMEGRMAWH